MNEVVKFFALIDEEYQSDSMAALTVCRDFLSLNEFLWMKNAGKMELVKK